jgi:hypothetical protein
MSGEIFCDDIDNADTEDHADTEVSVMVRILVFAGAQQSFGRTGGVSGA